jgi:Fe2+ transport system protein B
MAVPEEKELWKYVKKALLLHVINGLLLFLMFVLIMMFLVQISSGKNEQKRLEDRVRVLEQKCGK